MKTERSAIIIDCTFDKNRTDIVTISRNDFIWLENKIKELEAENTAAHARYDEVMAENRRLNGDLEQLEAAMFRIQTWIAAYPLEVFPEPDVEKARVVLNAADMTLDSITAYAMRHVLTGISRIISETGIEQAASGEVTE